MLIRKSVSRLRFTLLSNVPFSLYLIELAYKSVISVFHTLVNIDYWSLLHGLLDFFMHRSRRDDPICR